MAVVFLVGLSACSSDNGGGSDPPFGRKILDNQALESSDGVAKVLIEEYQVRPPVSVECPPNQEVKAGNTFTCTARIDDKEWAVDIKILDDKGTYEVGTPRDK